MTGESFPAIRTPDQRIRVFARSTLREPADEGRARAATERIRLAPTPMPAEAISLALPPAGAPEREALQRW